MDVGLRLGDVVKILETMVSKDEGCANKLGTIQGIDSHTYLIKCFDSSEYVCMKHNVKLDYARTKARVEAYERILKLVSRSFITCGANVQRHLPLVRHNVEIVFPSLEDAQELHSLLIGKIKA